MATKPDLSRTKGIRVGATMLFHPHTSTTDFGADVSVYNQVYNIGFRAVQVQPGDKEESWLVGCRQWASEQQEETTVGTIDFFVNAGDSPVCPAVDKPGTIQGARDSFEMFLAKSKLCGAESLFGPFTAGLLAGYYEWLAEHDDRCVSFLQFMEEKAAAAKLPVDVEPLNRFETGVSKLSHLARLFKQAGVGKWLKIGFDACHQGMSESSTVEAWREHNDLAGTCGHFSDTGRSVIGSEQAVTKSGVIGYLDSGQCATKTWFAEAFGKDTDPGILQALGVRVKPKYKGLDVMRKSFANIVGAFAQV